jgi:hypothetical protein
LEYKISDTWNIAYKSLINDFDYYNSPFRKAVRNLEEFKKLREITEFVLSENRTLIRPLLTRFINQLTTNNQQLYLGIINLAYYLGVVAAMPSFKLYCRKPYLYLINRKMSHDAPLLKQAGAQFFTKTAFNYFLKSYGLNLEELASLDIDSLREIRKSKVTIKFKTNLLKLINNWAEKKISEDDIQDIKKLELDLAETIRSKLAQERKLLDNLKRTKVTRENLSITGTIISGVSSLFPLLQTNYETGIISIATSGALLASGPIFNILIRNKSNFITFGELLKKKIAPFT